MYRKKSHGLLALGSIVHLAGSTNISAQTIPYNPPSGVTYRYNIQSPATNGSISVNPTKTNRVATGVTSSSTAANAKVTKTLVLLIDSTNDPD